MNACVHRLDFNLCSHPKEFLGMQSESMNACVHRLDFNLCSHPKEFLGMESESMLTPRKNPLCQRLRGGSNPRCITQGSKTNILPTELFQPPREHFHGCQFSLFPRRGFCAWSRKASFMLSSFFLWKKTLFWKVSLYIIFIVEGVVSWPQKELTNLHCVLYIVNVCIIYDIN